jgi:histidinol-phosphatase
MAPMADLAEDLVLARALADRADAITLARFRAADLEVQAKPDLTPVSEADTAAERAIREELSGARPGDAVVGEEYGSEGRAARRWIVDPIDGTANYVRGIPVWATLIALQEEGEAQVAVVSSPALGRRWWAARGQGAFGFDALTGQTRRLAVSGVGALAEAQLTFSGEPWLEGERGRAMAKLAAACRRTRGFGDYWAHMLVAEGAVDIAVDSPGVSLWDLAAPQLIVEEAGGRFTDLAGVRTASGGDALATNGSLHEPALALVGR